MAAKDDAVARSRVASPATHAGGNEALDAQKPHRSRRKRAVRAKTINVKRMTRRELAIGELLYPRDEHADVVRPKTRGDCQDAPRPCPFLSCTHHLYLDVSARTGAIKLNYPDLEPWELEHSCALDVADLGGQRLERVGELTNLTRERVRQIEVNALAKLVSSAGGEALRDYGSEGDGQPRKRRLPVVASVPRSGVRLVNDDGDDDDEDAVG